MFRALSIAATLLAVAGCNASPPLNGPSACDSAEPIGRFDPGTDVFIGHFDSKPDVDDLHTIAAVGSLLHHNTFACVKAIGVAGAYGTQGGVFIPSPELFDLAFGESWLDGHTRRADTVDQQAQTFVETLSAGGHVWIIIAGQADIAADALERAIAIAPDLPYASNLHLVQHSEWNESVTAPENLAFVQARADYQRIADGNFQGNGTPGYTTTSAADWTRVLADKSIGQIWAEAKRLADDRNPASAYVNPSVTAGGFDFSDTAEMTYIFGLESLNDVSEFFDYVLSQET